MKTVCHKEHFFSNSEKKEFWFGFNGGNITSDGGSLLIARAMKKMGLADNMASCLKDKRNPEKVTYTGFYEETMYSELLVFDGETGELISAKLRPGNIYTSDNAAVTIHRIVKELRKINPKMEIIVRGDSGYGIPELMDYCERNGVHYILGLKGNKRLERRTMKLRKRAKNCYGNKVKPVVFFGHFEYRSQSWAKPRVGFAKIDCDSSGLRTRYVVTNMKISSPKAGYAFYGKRGQMENYIKEVKNGMFCDRLSCHSYTAKYFRLMLSAFAYLVMLEIRNQLKGTELEKAEADTIRLKLFKVGGMVVETVRKVWIRFSSSYPGYQMFTKAYVGLSG